MHIPTLDDTIIAVSTAWMPSPLGVVRLSGADCFALLQRAGLAATAPPAARPDWCEARFPLELGFEIPVTLLRFPAPRSYTAQNVVELHVPGCLPLLRALCERLIALGARRALPGEFTARAYLADKLDADAVAGVLALLHAGDQADARRAARTAGAGRQRLAAAFADEVAALLASIEAGIDFAEEEDVSFISAEALRGALADLLRRIAAEWPVAGAERRGGLPHVALVGRPNAGKSSLFNALLGYERAIVSPVLGTTRDVLSGEICCAGAELVLQDCAGLGDSAEALDLQAHVATERAAEQADIVAWVHPLREPWTGAERDAASRFPAERRLLVFSKQDEAPALAVPVPAGFDHVVRVSALTGAGLDDLREALANVVGHVPTPDWAPVAEGVPAAVAALQRAADLAGDAAPAAELVALELRSAFEVLSRAPVVEAVLGRIFTQFCVGK